METQNMQLRLIYVGLILSLIFAIAVIDISTGVESQLYPLYFVPLVISAKLLGRTWTIIASQVCTISWFISKLDEGIIYQSNWYWLMNTVAQWGTFTFVAFLVSDTELKLFKEKRNARIDTLTELENRKGFVEHATQLIELSHRKCYPIVFAIIDLDNFKKVNDTLGHQRGDQILNIVADVMKSTLRASDLLGRIGGDEFVAFFPDMSLENSKDNLERMISAISAKMKSEHCDVTATIGAVAYKYGPKELDFLIAEADVELLRAKAAGKNCVSIKYCESSNMVLH